MAVKPTNETLQESAIVPDWLPALTALWLAKAEVIEQHCKSGRPIIIWRDGRVYHQPPEEARREMEDALKSERWPLIEQASDSKF